MTMLKNSLQNISQKLNDVLNSLRGNPSEDKAEQTKSQRNRRYFT